MSAQDNTAVVRRYYDEVLNQCNIDLLDDLAVEDYVEHDPFPGQGNGIADLKARVAGLCAAFDPHTQILAVGFQNGIFCIYSLPDFSELHTLSISAGSGIDTVCINSSGEWIALGSARYGQLLVWEWQSESYVLKQQVSAWTDRRQRF